MRLTGHDPWSPIGRDMPETTIRVLVAEDEPTLLNLNAQFLRQKGFEVTEASDGEQAWALASRGGFDLVLLDVMMPGMSGWEVCKKVKASPTSKNVAVVMLTGIGETLNEMNSPLFAADGWLNKPFDFDVLERKLREALAKYGKRMPDGGSDFYASNDEPPPSAPSAGPSVAKASPKKKAAPKKASPKKASPKKASPKKASPKKAAPKKAAKKAAPKKAAPKKAAKKAAPKKAAPKKAAKKAAPKKAAPKKAAPTKAAKKAAPKKAAKKAGRRA